MQAERDERIRQDVTIMQRPFFCQVTTLCLPHITLVLNTPSIALMTAHVPFDRNTEPLSCASTAFAMICRWLRLYFSCVYGMRV